MRPPDSDPAIDPQPVEPMSSAAYWRGAAERARREADAAIFAADGEARIYRALSVDVAGHLGAIVAVTVLISTAIGWVMSGLLRGC